MRVRERDERGMRGQRNGERGKRQVSGDRGEMRKRDGNGD